MHVCQYAYACMYVYMCTCVCVVDRVYNYTSIATLEQGYVWTCMHIASYRIYRQAKGWIYMHIGLYRRA